jgi:hypothetical protein
VFIRLRGDEKTWIGRHRRGPKSTARAGRKHGARAALRREQAVNAALRFMIGLRSNKQVLAHFGRASLHFHDFVMLDIAPRRVDRAKPGGSCE